MWGVLVLEHIEHVDRASESKSRGVLPGEDGGNEGYGSPGLALVVVVFVGPRRSTRVLARNAPDRLEPHLLPSLSAKPARQWEPNRNVTALTRNPAGRST